MLSGLKHTFGTEPESMKLAAATIRFAFIFVVVQLMCVRALAQTPEFRTETRLVLVDVVASDQNDQPIVGLKPDDFKVIEDGKVQQIRFFDAHSTAAHTKVAPNPRQLPPHVYTNVPEEEPGVVRTVVLFDTLNTPTSDQAYARREMVKFLKVLPKGQSIALFTL